MGLTAGLQLDPDTYYDEHRLRMGGLDGDAIRDAREAGELKFALAGKLHIYKGRWVIDWLDGLAERSGAK